MHNQSYNAHLFLFTFADGVYRLLYEEVDESEVPIVQFILPDDSAGMLDEFRYDLQKFKLLFCHVSRLPNLEFCLRQTFK